MASFIAHLVIGEYVFAQLPRFDAADLSGFLLGCVLVDVHAFFDVDRRATHFANRFDTEGDYSFDRSCINFLDQLGDLLARPWERLTSAEKAFVAGYLCHLAADEDWKRFDCYAMHKLGIRWWTDFSIPVSVILTAFDTLSSELYDNAPAVTSALSGVSIPNVLTHVPHGVFQAMWDVTQARCMDGSTPESYFEMLGRLGKTGREIQAARHEHQVYWADAVALIQDFFGGIQPRIQAMVGRSLERVPLLFQRAPQFRSSRDATLTGKTVP